MNDLNELMTTGGELMDNMKFLVSFLPFIAGLIAAYAMEIKLIKKINFLWDKTKKIEQAKAKGQVVTGYLKSREREALNDNDPLVAKYEYEINGKKRSRVVHFGMQIGNGISTYPKKIAIYYLGNRTYTDYEKPSIIDALLVLPLFFAAAYVAIGLQLLISPASLFVIYPELQESMYLFKNCGLVILAFLVICTILCKVYDVMNVSTQ